MFSVSSSRGCRARCSFCAYNSDTTGWVPLSLRRTVDDIATVAHNSDVRRFAIGDNDFGGSRREALQRAHELAQAVESRRISPYLTVSMRPVTLTEPTIKALTAAGVDTLLCGVESFTPEFQVTRFNKKATPVGDLAKICGLLDTNGITPVCSYILWHPWQTLDTLRAEIEAINQLGRHRIPQFAYRSRLQVQPGTKIETDLDQADLLTKGWLHRNFYYMNEQVRELADDLQAYAQDSILPNLAGINDGTSNAFELLGTLKTEEWEWLQARL